MSVRHAVLGLLAEEPDHGYRLKQRFDERVGAVWGLNLGQVYQTLALLEAKQLIRRCDEPTGKTPPRGPVGARDTIRYELTHTGEAVLSKWLRRTPSAPKPMRDELLVRLLFLADRDPEEAIARIESQESLYKGYLAALRSRERNMEAADDDETLGAVIGLDAARLHAEAHVKWLENCRLRFEQLCEARRRDDGKA